MPEGKLGGTWRAQRKTGIMSKTPAWPDCELESMLQIKEGDRSVLEFLAKDAFRPQAQTVTVELEGFFQVVDAERDYSYPWFHARPLTGRGPADNA